MIIHLVDEKHTDDQLRKPVNAMMFELTKLLLLFRKSITIYFTS